MAETKKTQKEMFAYIAEAMAHDAEVVEFCEKKVAQLSKPRKHKVNTEAAEFAAGVATYMADAEGPLTNKEIATGLDVKTQKSAAALKRLVSEGVVIRNDETKPSTFTLA